MTPGIGLSMDVPDGGRVDLRWTGAPTRRGLELVRLFLAAVEQAVEAAEATEPSDPETRGEREAARDGE